MFTGLIRTIILYLLIIAGIRLMGKRQVGELEPSELVLSLIIADLAAVPMQDFGIPLLTGICAAGPASSSARGRSTRGRCAATG